MRFINRVVSSVLVLAVATGLAGCSSGNSKTSISNSDHKTEAQSESSTASAQNTSSVGNDENEHLPLEITDIAYVPFAGDSGHLFYTFALKNPNKNAIANGITVDFTGRAEDGSIAFNDSWVFGPVPADSVTYWASTIGSDHAASAKEITRKISVPDYGWFENTLKTPLYKFANVSVLNEDDDTAITGEITMLEDAEIDGATTRSPMIVAVFKDNSGKIVDGAFTFYNSELVKDEKAAFELRSMRSVPENYASVELYANPWY